MVDLALAVPTCSVVAAKRALPLVARVGTLGTARLIGRVSDAVYELRNGEAVARPLPDDDSPGQPGGNTVAEAPEPAPSITPDELPIEGYDDLAARQVVDRLTALDRADLARVELYERAHRNRSTVLGKISMLTA
jgi:hypothetical protein